MIQTRGTLLLALAGALRRAGTYNRDDQAPPVAVLWPDRERQWEPLAPLLRELLPILTLGSYAPKERTVHPTGSAAVGAFAAEVSFRRIKTPIIYLPGISKQDIRAVELPPLLQPCRAEYSGTLWTQVNGKDWTVLAFIQTTAGGLGIGWLGILPRRRRSDVRCCGWRMSRSPACARRLRYALRSSTRCSILTPCEVCCSG